MEIIWDVNPMKTRIRLDDLEKEIFRLRLRISELESEAYSAYFHLDPEVSNGAYLRPEESLTYLKSIVKSLDREKGEDNEMFVMYLSELESGYHCGDCTCIPATCSKCCAEEEIGINTIAGLGKHQASKVSGIFESHPDWSVDQAIEYLADYAPVRSGEWLKFPPEAFNAHLPRWTQEAAHAAKWLRAYRDEKLAVGKTIKSIIKN